MNFEINSHDKIKKNIIIPNKKYGNLYKIKWFKPNNINKNKTNEIKPLNAVNPTSAVKNIKYVHNDNLVNKKNNSKIMTTPSLYNYNDNECSQNICLTSSDNFSKIINKDLELYIDEDTTLCLGEYMNTQFENEQKINLSQKLLINPKKYCRYLNNLYHKSFSFNYTQNINNVNFCSGSFSIIKNDNNYILGFRCVNYCITLFNEAIRTNNACITVNRFLKTDNKFNIIHENKLIIPDTSLWNTNLWNIQSWDKTKDIYYVLGIEDLKMFYHDGKINVIGTTQTANGKIGMCVGNYDYETNIIHDIKFINPIFNYQHTEKNWVYFKNIDDKLLIIYKWFPLQVCDIYNNFLHLVKEISMPIFFKDARGSSCGFNYRNEIWFIVHFNDNGNYYHSIVIFDLYLNLKKHTTKFKFRGNRVEFCIGLHIENDKIIIPHSISDSESYINIYDINNIYNELEWEVII
jgi:hypothetical protein